jgi:glycosyltransferase involved in cell wall biosynthesis
VRVVLLTHYYPPEVGAPQTRLAELAAGLASRGVEVTVHTGFPHYPAGGVRAPYRNRPLVRERGAGGERVVRSAVYPAANRGFARRLLDHLAFGASALATARATGPADVVVVESPPLFLAGAGALYAAAKRAPLVLNVADLWPESAVALGMLRDRRAIALARALERGAYRRAAAIAAPTAGIAAALEREPAAAGRVERLGPAVDAARFAGVPAPPAAGGRLEVLYAGTVGLAQGIGTLVEAARLAGPGAVGVTIAGDGAEAEAIARAAPGNVRLLGTVPAAAVPALYAAADAGAALLRAGPLFEGALPTKLFECMAAGRPVVVAARGEAAALVERTGAGIAVAPERPDLLAAAFRRLAADRGAAAAMGERGRAAVAAEFGRAAWVERWLELLERVAAQGTRL